MAMRIKCSDCPRTKKYINLGSCPVCFAKPMLMDIRTHNAKCNECGAEFGVPMAVEGLCAEDIRNRRYCVTIQSKPKKQDMLEIATILGQTVSQLYPLFKNGLPVVIDDISMRSAFAIMNYMGDHGVCAQAQPPLEEYPLFEQCMTVR